MQAKRFVDRAIEVVQMLQFLMHYLTGGINRSGYLLTQLGDLFRIFCKVVEDMCQCGRGGVAAIASALASRHVVNFVT